MSTERPTPERRIAEPTARERASAERTERTQLRRFRRTSLATLLVLAVAAAGLGVAAVVRGPTLDSGAVNAQAAIARSGQRLLLQVDQPITAVAADQVTVTPSTPFDLTAETNALTITFTAPLAYATDYEVRVEGVTGASTGLAGTLDYRFRTPDVEVTTLLRRGGFEAGADKPTDQILRSTLSPSEGVGTDVAFEAPRIQQYAETDEALAVIALDEQGTSSLVVSNRGTEPVTVYTPSGGRIQSLHASTQAGLFGYTVTGGQDGTGRQFQNTLFVFDPLAPSGKPVEITGFGGEPLRVAEWQFVPGSSALVVQGLDQQLFLIDPLDADADGAVADPTPLGRHAEMRDFLAGGLKLVVADPAGTSTIDLADGTVEPLVQPQPEVDPALYPGTVLTLASGATVRQYDEIDYTAASPVASSLIVYADEAGTRELYRPPSAGSRVRSFCVSPNGQYLAVETIGSGALSDGYPLPGYSDMTTYFVEIATGAVTRGVAGFQPDWCG